MFSLKNSESLRRHCDVFPLIFFQMYEYVHVPTYYVNTTYFQVPSETRRGYQIPLELEVQGSCEVLEVGTRT